jgi:hypothetical protein
MTTDIADPKALSEVIRERMDTKIVEFMPDEVFDKMFQAAVADLTQSKVKEEYGRRQAQEPLLQKMIRDALAERLNNRIKELLSSDEWSKHFARTANGTYLSDGINKAIEKNAHTILANMLRDGIGVQIESAVSDALRSRGVY